MDARLLGLILIILSMSKRSEYGELLRALLRLALMADARGLPSLEPAIQKRKFNLVNNLIEHSEKVLLKFKKSFF